MPDSPEIRPLALLPYREDARDSTLGDLVQSDLACDVDETLP